MSQNFTSAGTSINKNKLPAIYRKLGKTIEGKSTLDYGCGRYVDHIREHLESINCTPFFYDPYNRTEKQNSEWICTQCGYHAIDVAICSNVLNVIDDEKSIEKIIDILGYHAKEAYLTVYEGDKSGKGRQTGPDQYQRNEKAQKYLDRIVSMGYWAELRNGVIHMRMK